MKLTKYLLLACAPLLFAACGNDDDWNTDGDVTVEMAKATMQVKENVSMVYVPLQVNGTANGPIRVTVEVTEDATTPAVEDEHYVLTSKTVVIPDNDEQISLELALTNDLEINENRIFTITIVNVEGAAIGQQNTTEVTIVDDDSMFYEALQGEWTFACKDSKGADVTYKVTVSGFDEGEDGYEETLYMSGLQGYNWVVTELTYAYDKDTNTISLSIPCGQVIATEVNFGLGGLNDVVFATIDGGYVYFNGEVESVVDANLRKITFDPDVTATGAIFAGTQFAGYVWFQYHDMVMTR